MPQPLKHESCSSIILPVSQVFLLFQQKFADFYAGSKKLPIYGFTFDIKPVETEIAAVANVKEAYALSLFTGAVDPATALPELLSKLEEAGIQKIVDEANAQLAAFLGE